MTNGQESLRTVSTLPRDGFGAQLSAGGIGVQIGPFSVRLAIRVSELTDTLYSFYKDYPLVEDDAVYSFHARLQHWRKLPRLHRRLVRFTVDGRKPHDDMPAEQALPVLEWGLNLVIALRSQSFLMLHAAVVERNGFAMIMPAAPGYGKTTLCAGLSHRGWRTLSDEFGLIRPGTPEMIPVPRPMALKNESIEVIRSFAPDAFIGPATPNTRKGTVAHVRPTSDSIARQGDSAPVSTIVFPRWVADAECRLEEMPKSESFMFLASNAFNYELLGEAAFRTIGNLVAGAECYRLEYSDLNQVTSLLTDMADSNAR